MTADSTTKNTFWGTLTEGARWRLKRLRQRARVGYLSWRNPEICISGVYIPLSKYISDNVREAMFDGGYESAELRTIADNLSPEDTVLEIGTGIGLISSVCSKRIGSDRVHTFEANPELEQHIRRVYARNAVSPQLQICILGDGEGEASFYVHDDFWSSSTYQRSPISKHVTVPRHDINETIKRLHPTFLIMDIEGGESELFRIMELDGIRKLAIELHTSIVGETRIQEIRSILAEHGFEVDWRYSSVTEGFKQELYLYR